MYSLLRRMSSILRYYKGQNAARATIVPKCTTRCVPISVLQLPSFISIVNLGCC